MPVRVWGFKSPLRHSRNPRSGGVEGLSSVSVANRFANGSGTARHTQRDTRSVLSRVMVDMLAPVGVFQFGTTHAGHTIKDVIPEARWVRGRSVRRAGRALSGYSVCWRVLRMGVGATGASGTY